MNNWHRIDILFFCIKRLGTVKAFHNPYGYVVYIINTYHTYLANKTYSDPHSIHGSDSWWGFRSRGAIAKFRIQTKNIQKQILVWVLNRVWILAWRTIDPKLWAIRCGSEGIQIPDPQRWESTRQQVCMLLTRKAKGRYKTRYLKHCSCGCKISNIVHLNSKHG